MMSVRQLEDFGRVQLSKSFFMRDFLYSEISQIERIPNIPENPELAIRSGTKLCELLLEPLQDRFGRIAIRSAYRSPTVNEIGAANNNQYSCGSNISNAASHIWDSLDADGYAGATTCIVVPALLPWYKKTGDWTPLAWWIHHNLPYASQYWFPKLAAFNLSWSENPTIKQSIRTYVTNPHTQDKKTLVQNGQSVLNPERCNEIINLWLSSLQKTD